MIRDTIDTSYENIAGFLATADVFFLYCVNKVTSDHTEWRLVPCYLGCGHQRLTHLRF